jgi:hypothetical protein
MSCQSSSQMKKCKTLLTLSKTDAELGTHMLSVFSVHGKKKGIEAVL